jgi:hypothetical protein
MASYFVELRERKKSLNEVKRALRDLDTQGEKFERKLNVWLRRKKFMYDADDAHRLNEEIGKLRKLFTDMEVKASTFNMKVSVV